MFTAKNNVKATLFCGPPELSKSFMFEVNELESINIAIFSTRYNLNAI